MPDSSTPAASFDITRVVRPNILRLEPYRCARDDFSSGLLLDANENSYGPAYQACVEQEGGQMHVSPQADRLQLHRYPDPQGLRVKQRVLALRPGVDGVDNVFLGVGSDEIIDLVVRITCQPGRDKILITPPTYGMYRVVASINDVGVAKVPLLVDGGAFQLDVDGVIAAAAADPTIKVIWLCSPGNPTGTALRQADVRRVLGSGFGGVVVVDEAYVDFAREEHGGSCAALVAAHPALLVMQTLSKSFGLAGIRLGVGIGGRELVSYLNRAKAPYNVSTLALDVAETALSDDGIRRMRRVAGCLRAQRDDYLIPELLRLPRVAAVLGGNDANFVLCRLADADGRASNDVARHVYTEMALHRGLVVRFRGTDYGCDGCLRITVGTPAENRQVVATMRSVLSAMP
ncbi:histidinol-phosphate transaminase [Coemansia sp. RSA 1836]|nr:histidinol-phosphate transaminase [Coemansia sp. RSA 25]KAJ2561069.1 histidinol-phosphate transaminase [Coemansia sp. RSA 1836]